MRVATGASNARAPVEPGVAAPRGAARYRIGIDVGGTFTDLVLVAPTARSTLDKMPTTPRDQSRGVMGGIGAARGRARASTRASSSRAPTWSCTAPPPPTTR